MMSSGVSQSASVLGVLGRIVVAALGGLVLLVLLVLMRVLDRREDEVVELREMETMEEVAPPPPPSAGEVAARAQLSPPPPPPPLQPQLDLVELPNAPAVPALRRSEPSLAMVEADFELLVERVEVTQPVARPAPARPASPSLAASQASRPSAAAPSPAPAPEPQRTHYDSGELDGVPSLRHRPDIDYPRALARRGVRSGRVVLRVTIDQSGRARVDSVRSSTHPDLTPVAVEFANGARFSVPTKDGRAVSTSFTWPINLRE